MIRNILLLALTLVSFVLQDKVISTVSDYTAPKGGWSTVTAPLAQRSQMVAQNVAYSVTHPGTTFPAGVTSVQQVTGWFNQMGLPTPRPAIRSL